MFFNGFLYLVQDLENHVKLISHNGRLRVLALVVGHAHDYIRWVDQRLFVQRGSDFAGDLEVHLVGDGLVGQVVLAGDGQAKITGGNDAVVVLDDDVVGVATGRLPLDSAVDVVVAEGDGELELAVDVFHAGFGAALGVDLSVEESWGQDVGAHVAGVALDADVVAGRQLVGRGFLDGQVRFFDLETKK